MKHHKHEHEHKHEHHNSLVDYYDLALIGSAQLTVEELKLLTAVDVQLGPELSSRRISSSERSSSSTVFSRVLIRATEEESE